MGKKMRNKNLAFISIKSIDGKFKGYLSMEAVFGGGKDPEVILHEATIIYQKAINKMIFIVNLIKDSRAKHNPVAARKIWQLGDTIFELRDELEKIGLEIDGVYDHLSRDLEVKKKWLEKVVILRRYLPDINLIPESLNWGYFEKGTRRKAENLKSGLPLS